MSDEATGAADGRSGGASPSSTGRYTPPVGLTIQLPSEAVQELDALRAMFKKPADTNRHARARLVITFILIMLPHLYSYLGAFMGTYPEAD